MQHKIQRIYKHNPFPSTQKDEIDYYEYRGIEFEKVTTHRQLGHRTRVLTQYQIRSFPEYLRKHLTSIVAMSQQNMVDLIDNAYEDCGNAIRFIKESL